MTLPKAEVVNGLAAEMQRFHDLIIDLTDDAWGRPTRCEAWSVGQLAAHVTGVSADLIAGRVDGLGTQAWYDRQVEERDGQPPAVVAAELAGLVEPTHEQMSAFPQEAWDGPAPPGVPGALGGAVQSLWCGTYIHAEDILAALRKPPLRGAGLRAAVWQIADTWQANSWGPTTLDLDGIEEIIIDGGGERITGDPLPFVLAATGRGDAAALGLNPTVNIYA
jgi:uncharacterized protein (TIGR03083 family)